jgi:hypothetical protein
VYLEEFTDALQSLDWNLPIGVPPTSIAPNPQIALNSSFCVYEEQITATAADDHFEINETAELIPPVEEKDDELDRETPVDVNRCKRQKTDHQIQN